MNEVDKFKGRIINPELKPYEEKIEDIIYKIKNNIVPINIYFKKHDKWCDCESCIKKRIIDKENLKATHVAIKNGIHGVNCNYCYGKGKRWERKKRESMLDPCQYKYITCRFCKGEGKT